MEVAMELEDDLFFADLSKQISLLIMDDEEDPLANYPPVSFQAMSRGNYYPNMQYPLMNEQNCRRESKGTGVFIPTRSSQPRRKNKQGRYNNCTKSNNSKQQHDYNNTKMTNYHVSCNNSFIKLKKG